jgi:hypothetical protein
VAFGLYVFLSLDSGFLYLGKWSEQARQSTLLIPFLPPPFCRTQAKEQEAVFCCKERDAIKADLDVLLQQRGQIQGLKSLLQQRLNGGPQAAGMLQQEWHPQIRRAPTTITGEGR